MTVYKDLILAFGLSILGLFVVSLGMGRVTFSSVRSQREEQLAPLTKQALTLSSRGAGPLAGLKNPFGAIDPIRSDFPPVPLAEITGGVRPPDRNRVSMILLQDRQKMAVIDDQVVKEGDAVNQDKVLRIEKDRVLLKTAHTSERWVALAPEKDQSSSRPDTVQSSSPLTTKEGKAVEGRSGQAKVQDERRKSNE